jgi:Xaa-Pro aminopeptidase
MNVSRRLESFAGVVSGLHLVLRMEDIRWLTGFTGSTAQLLVNADSGESWLLVDGRYVERAAEELRLAQSTTVVQPVVGGALLDEVLQKLVGSSSFGVDPAHLTAAHMDTLGTKFSVEKIASPCDDLRRVKDDDEIAAISLAASIADGALQQVVADGLCGHTEKQVRVQLDYLMKLAGADDVGFDTIVATGVHGARPHHEPTDMVIEDGHGVIIDMGALVNGYRSDMTRTIKVGAVSKEYEQMWDIVCEAQKTGVAAVREGVVGSEVDAAVCAIFEREGVRHEYPHGTGHGVGLYIHEPPIFSSRCTAVLGNNEVVTVEPGLYRGGVGGVRIEDLVVVTGNTCRILTLTPKDLTCPRSPQTI